jgi:hypothetical protein
MQPVYNRQVSTGPVRSELGSTKPFHAVVPVVHNAYDSYKESI